jgi:hypothetical protein
MIEATQQLATTGRRVKVQHEQFRLIRFNITLDKKSCLIIYKNLYIVLLRIELNLIKTCSLTNIFQVQLFCLLGLMSYDSRGLHRCWCKQIHVQAVFPSVSLSCFPFSSLSTSSSALVVIVSLHVFHFSWFSVVYRSLSSVLRV